MPVPKTWSHLIFQRFHFQLLGLEGGALGFKFGPLLLDQAAEILHFAFDGGVFRLRRGRLYSFRFIRSSRSGACRRGVSSVPASLASLANMGDAIRLMLSNTAANTRIPFLLKFL